MRLLNARRFLALSSECFEVFQDDEVPPYAIISHRWSDGEVSIHDVRRQSDLPALIARQGYWKVVNACKLAIEDLLEYIWIDTACIDKSSSAELQEAINSMFQWYSDAEVCYVYLHDLKKGNLLCKPRFYNDMYSWYHGLRWCSWWTRGWTLQELIAPRKLHFYDASWKKMASLDHLVEPVSKITGIQAKVLLHETTLGSVSVAKRMSWAAGRQTTRIEDRAYSMLGIFNVNMPMLYGEKDKAFTRLQEEIIRSSTDASILAWRNHPYEKEGRLLARSPDDFAYSKGVTQSDTPTSFQLTNTGLRLSAPLFSLEDDGHCAAILNCLHEGRMFEYGAIEKDMKMKNFDPTPTQAKFGTQLTAVALRLRLDALRPSHWNTFYVEHTGSKDSLPKGCFNESFCRIVHVDLATAQQALWKEIIILKGDATSSSSYSSKQTGRFCLRLDPSLQIVEAWPSDQWNLNTRMLTTESLDGCGSATLQHASSHRITVVFNAERTWNKKMSYEAGFAPETVKRPHVQGVRGPRFVKHQLRKKTCQLGDDTFEVILPEAGSRIPAIVVRIAGLSYPPEA